jgi:hypothetical protein
MENRLSFGKIHIIEWLWKVNPETGVPDRRTGHEVYTDLKALIPASGSRMEVILHRVGSRAAFLGRLKRIEQDFRLTGRIPFLQIETHGDDEGIGLTIEDGLSWPDLMEALTPLNMATGLRLPVVMASCEGIWGIKMANPMQRAPFLALLGPVREVLEAEVVRGMKAFYRGVFIEKDGNKAMRMLNDAVNPTKGTFDIYNCQKLFADVWDGYLEQTQQPGVSDVRADRMMENGRAMFGELPPAEAARARERMRAYAEDYPTQFAESKQIFFMTDLYPDNDRIFNVTLDPVPPEPETVGA